jgi:hypothetical protein
MPHILPRYIRHRDAPAYLGMCRDEFDSTVRPFLTEIPVGARGVAFDRLDLDAWATHHKSTKGRPPRYGDQPWQRQERPESSFFRMAAESSTRSIVAKASTADSVKSRRTKPNSDSKKKSQQETQRASVSETIDLCLQMGRHGT